LRVPDEDQLMERLLPPHGARERQFIWWILCDHVGPVTTISGRPQCGFRVGRADAKYTLGLLAEEDEMPIGITNYDTYGKVFENRRQDVGFLQACQVAATAGRHARTPARIVPCRINCGSRKFDLRYSLGHRRTFAARLNTVLCGRLLKGAETRKPGVRGRTTALG
jgi:hypothetical protein